MHVYANLILNQEERCNQENHRWFLMQFELNDVIWDQAADCISPLKNLQKNNAKIWGQMPHRLLYILELFILNIDIYPIYLLIPKIDNDASRKRHKHVHIFVIHQNVTK